MFLQYFYSLLAVLNPLLFLFPSEEMSYLCVVDHGCVAVEDHVNQTDCSKFLFYPKLPVWLSCFLSVCLHVCENKCVGLRCLMTLHTSRSRFTFYTHILSVRQQLSVSLFAVQFSVCWLADIVQEQSLHSNYQFYYVYYPSVSPILLLLCVSLVCINVVCSCNNIVSPLESFKFYFIIGNYIFFG